MIREILDTLKNRLEEYLNAYFNSPEGYVQIGGIPVGSDNAPNKLSLSVVNLERETAMGIGSAYRMDKSQEFVERLPAWYLNMDVLFASVFDEKRYAEGLDILSKVIYFLQQYSVLDLPDGKHYTIELVTLNMQELTNLWSMSGGRYYPSVLCKIRMLTFENDAIQSTAYSVKVPGVKMNS